ncbi:hypothetical protein LCGC14_0367010 [marine sediment metagenome]|uniref:Terminase small subunit n=1 Tax=marine sediment metagenome TaxID=412755 RepID=A0A0F9T662_9ZZZZ
MAGRFKGKRNLVRNREGRLLAEGSRLFLPGHLDQVRAIAMRGINEDQMSELFDINRRQIGTWKKQYPLFKEALEDGYTDADAAVLSALYQSAVGYTHDEEKLFFWDGDVTRAPTVKHYKPDVTAIKLWITNRQRDHWKDRQHTAVSGGDGDSSPLGLRDETKLEVMSSILALIQSKPDNAVTIDGKTGEVVEE